jgi:phage-related protein (TIGR01555 family)
MAQTKSVSSWHHENIRKEVESTHMTKDELERQRLNARGKQILQRQKAGAVRPHREDGYVNLLNKYGTSQDNSEAYQFEREPIIPDMQLTGLYEGNGLFSKIIDTPAEEALKHGFDLNLKNDEVNAFVEEALDELEWEEKAATAIKWARLYGGALIVMLINDGGGLEQPVNWQNVKSIDELRVYERAIVQPDYSSLYRQDYGGKGEGNRVSKFGQPEFYYVSSVYGSFRVHESRCLVFRNGVLPEQTSNSIYRFWGMPEYVRIRRALRETVTAHTDSVKLLERSVQAIYSMKGLATLLTTDDGENQVLKRLNVIDTARGILNSLVIDADGENYDFKTFQFSGVKDVIDATCNMLSALTNIPQTILFGRSPAGMNATGTSDFESYYNFVEKIQRLMLKRNLRTLLDVIFRAGIASGAVEEEPDYKLEFNPLWSLSDTEQATVDQTKAQTAQIKAQTAQVYVDMQALDPTEVRKRLASDEEFDVEDIISEGEDDDDLLQALLGSSGTDMANEVEAAQMNAEQQQTPGGAEQSAPAPNSAPAVTDNADGDTNRGVGVLIVQEGKLLCGTRVKEGSIGGPGGHIEAGESPEAAAIRETQEEFGITPKDLIPITYMADLKPPYCPSQVYLCTDFDGYIKCDDDEMTMPGFIAADKVLKLATEHPERIFPLFAESISALLDVLTSDSPLTADGQNGRMNSERTDADSDKIRWITTESGTHIPLGDEGEAVGGFAKGQKFPSAKSEPSKPASDTPEHKADPQHKSEPKASGSKESSPAPAVAPKSFGSADAPSFAKSLKTAYDKMEETAPEKAWRVTVHSQQELEEEYPGAKLHITDGGSTVAVTKDGDIISVCKNPDDSLRGKDLLKMAVANGGKKLDAYSGIFGFYTKCGFEPVSWCEFDEQYAPPDWVKGRDEPEPVIFYKYTGNKSQFEDANEFFAAVPASADYGAAQETRDGQVEEEKHES